MSETLGSATLELSTDDRKLRSGIKDAKKQAKKLSQDLGRVGKRMTASLTLPILGMGAAILKVAADFETGMNRVQALTSATGEEFTKLEDQAKELGATTQFSAGQAADAMGFLAQAGLSVEEIYSTLPSTLDLAAASEQDLATTADQLTNIMQGFGLAADQAGRAADVLTAASTGSNTKVVQLAEAMSFAGPVAKAFGISFEETAAAVGLLGNAGIQASRAGTALSGALVRLSAPAKNNAELMEKLGINVLDSAGNMLPLVGIIKQLEESGASASEMMQIFGQRAGPAMLALVSQGSEALENFTRVVDESGGKAGEIAAVQMQGLTGAIKALRSAVEAVAIAIAQSGLLEFVTDAAVATANWFRDLSKTNPVLLKWGAGIAIAAAALGPLLIALSSLVSIMTPIITGLLVISGTFAAVGGAILALGIALVVLEDVWVGALETVFGKSEEWAGKMMRFVFGPTIDTIKFLIDLWRSFVDLIGLGAPDIVEAIPGGAFSTQPESTSTEEIVNAPGGVPAAIITQQRAVTINVGEDTLLDGNGLRRLVERINDEIADDATQLQVQTI